MLKLYLPPYTAEQVFTECISRVRSPGLKARLTAATPSIAEIANSYEAAAQVQALQEIARTPLVNGDVTTAEMDAVYSNRMAKQASPGRHIYDEIFAAAKGRCPLCGHRIVTTLDHHLPKAHYPALAVVPANLVASCSDCNKTKLASIPHHPEDVSLHPYFDDLMEDRWLYAEVQEVVPAAVRFRVEPPEELDKMLAERLRRHFVGFRISALYGSEAAEELLNIRHLLISLHDIGGADQVRGHLEEYSQSCIAGRLNGWRGATYEAWAGNDWFCDGGFAAIG